MLIGLINYSLLNCLPQIRENSNQEKDEATYVTRCFIF